VLFLKSKGRKRQETRKMIPTLIYTVRRNNETVRQFETYQQAFDFVDNSSDPELLHITTDKC
jgi:hypothetical protein